MDGLTPLGLDSQPQPPPPHATPPTPHLVVGIVAIVVGFALMGLRALAWSYWIVGPETMGYATGGSLLPDLTAYLIAARRPIENVRRFGLAFAGMCLLLFFLMPVHPVDLKQHVGNLMKEASGTKAADANSPTLDNLLRDMMRGILEDRKAFDLETSRFSAELKKLYSVETFSSKEAMQKSIDAVHGIVASDERYSKRLEGIPDRMQDAVSRSSLQESDKRDFMDGVRKGFANQKALEIRRQATEVEQQWGSATITLYEFAMANASKIRADGSHLVIGDKQVRRQFNEKLETTQKLRSEVSKLNSQLVSAQREAMQQAGITMKDVGLESSDQNGK